MPRPSVFIRSSTEGLEFAWELGFIEKRFDIKIYGMPQHGRSA